MRPSLKYYLEKTVRLSSARFRVMPQFIIVGAQRSGTSFLYHSLTHHPQVMAAQKKELHFFDMNFDRGLYWYRAHFPLARIGCVSGEASPYYLFHPLTPGRIHASLPSVKLIVLLRNPVARAYSHYCFVSQNGHEPLSFEEALEKEAERLRGEQEKIIANPDYHSVSHRRYSYFSRGIYVDQLKIWRGFFPAEQMLILKSEDLFLDPQGILNQTANFLGLKPISWRLSDFNNHVVCEPMKTKTRETLAGRFEAHNKRLYEFLGRNLGWD